MLSDFHDLNMDEELAIELSNVKVFNSDIDRQMFYDEMLELVKSEPEQPPLYFQRIVLKIRAKELSVSPATLNRMIGRYLHPDIKITINGKTKKKRQNKNYIKLYDRKPLTEKQKAEKAAKAKATREANKAKREAEKKAKALAEDAKTPSPLTQFFG